MFILNKISLLSILLLSFSLSAFAQKSYDDYVKDALEYTTAKDYVAAEQSYKAALREEPAHAGNVLLFMNLGTIQRHLGKYEEALISYNIVIQKSPKLSYALKSRALLYHEMGRSEDALKDYSSVLLYDTENIEVLYERGLILLSLKNIEGADGDFKKIISIDKDNYRGKVGTAMVLKRKGEWEQAEQIYTELISLYKNRGELYANRAETYLYLQKFKNMKADLDKATENEYDDISVYILRGQYQLAQYDKDAAKKEFFKAKEMGADEELVNEYLLLCK